MASITFSIPGPEAPQLKKKIQDEALKRGLSVSEYVVECVAAYMRANP